MNESDANRVFEIGVGLWSSSPDRARRRRIARNLMDLAEQAIGPRPDRPPRSRIAAKGSSEDEHDDPR